MRESIKNCVIQLLMSTFLLGSILASSVSFAHFPILIKILYLRKSFHLRQFRTVDLLTTVILVLSQWVLWYAQLHL